MIQKLSPTPSPSPPSIPKRALLGIALLGLLGGILWESCLDLFRIWGRHTGHSMTHLDGLNLLSLGCTLKILWAPLFSLPPPLVRNLGVRKGWMVLMLGLSIVALIFLAQAPFLSVIFFAGAGILMLASKSFDMLTSASQIRLSGVSNWGIGESLCVNGYRLGIALTVNLALGFWALGGTLSPVLWGIALCLAGALGILIRWKGFNFLSHGENTPLNPLSPFSFRTQFILPFQSILQKSNWIWVLLLMLTYRAQDSLLDPVRSFFFMARGFSLSELAVWIKTLGIISVSLGGMAAGLCIRRFGYFKVLTGGLLLHGGAGFLLWKASMGNYSENALIFIHLMEQTTKGFSMIALFSSQLVLCRPHPEYAVTHLSIFMTLSWGGMSLVSCFSGRLADTVGWTTFLALAVCSNLLAIVPLVKIRQRIFL